MSRVAWITGASQGIGRALALELAQRGWQVAASARSEEALDKLASEAVGLAGTIQPYVLDVTEPLAHKPALGRIEAALGPVERAVLNAGTHQAISPAAFSADEVRKLVELNLMGVVYGLEALLPKLRERGAGQIAAVASLSGYRGLPTASGYGATKAALINLCEALRLDLAGSGVDVRLINPGFVKTPLTDRNRFSMPFLISAAEAARRIADGLDGRRFEIRFPTRFALMLGLLRHLPYGLYFPLVRKITG